MRRSVNRLAIVLVMVIILLLSVIPWLSLHLWMQAVEYATGEDGKPVPWQYDYALRLDDFVLSRTGDLVYAAPIRVAEELRTSDTSVREHGFTVSAATFFQLVIFWRILVAIIRFWRKRAVVGDQPLRVQSVVEPDVIQSGAEQPLVQSDSEQQQP